MTPRPQPDGRTPASPRLVLPAVPALVASGGAAFCLDTDGELKRITPRAAAALHMPLVCHAPRTARLLGLDKLPAFDVLELFAFVRPGQACAPTPRGLARALSLLEPASAEDACLALRDAARHLLAALAAPGREERTNPAAIAAMMGLSGTADNSNAAGWPWTPFVLAALGRENDPPARGEIKAALNIFDRLPEWAAHAPPPPPGHHGVSEDEARDALSALLLRQRRAERAQQQDYAAALSAAFAPANGEGETHVVMAEAGTGVGKTLGYLAPAAAWAGKNGGAVWVSTYTRNLQRQIDAELERLYPDPAEKSRRAVTRKGRENYLCLLNLEDAGESPSIHTHAPNAIALGLVLRWAAVTRDGDLAGRDFPGWLPGLAGRPLVLSLADRRGECIYSACPHFNKCFVEKSVRRSQRADVVIANHALVMSQAAEGADMPARFIFDEGHHLFDAADSAFSACLDGTETAELRRWILGAETGRKTRARGVKRRLEDLAGDDEAAQKDIDALMQAARALPAPLWRERLATNQPKGPAETFLSLCRGQVLARNKDADGPYSLETPPHPPLPGLPAAAAVLAKALRDIQRPLLSLAARLEKKLADEADTLDTDTRERLRFSATSLRRRGRDMAGAWIDMLNAFNPSSPSPPTSGGEGWGEGGGAASASLANSSPASPPPSPHPLPPKGGERRDLGFVDWLEITRADGAERDVGFHRRHVDPAAVFAAALKPHAHGVAVTSATLRDGDDWGSGLARAGVPRLSPNPSLFHAPSPFDYAARTRVIVVTDVAKDSPDEVAAAFRALFIAAKGGALGLFTAVQRLRAAHARLLPALGAEDIQLYAQHADGLDTGTLVDIFREEEDACLLGTDAARDGIDVPGRALRLVVYDRVPWPRPDILHKARRAHFGKNYDDMLARARLRQAYGRLIRAEEDKGVFVMLDPGLPTRLLSAFPDGVEVHRTGLKNALEMIKSFL